MPIAYSTGPMENQVSGSTLDSTQVRVKIDNLNKCAGTSVIIKIFELNGTRVQIGTTFSTTVGANSSTAPNFTLPAGTFNFEVQIQVNRADVLVSAWGRKSTGVFTPEHRVLHSEMVRIDNLS